MGFRFSSSAIWQDARFGVRMFLRTPAITISIILLLAVGMGANAAMFSVVDALLLHPVRYQDWGKLVFVWSHDPQGGLSDISAADFMDLRAKSKGLRDYAAWVPTSFVVIGGERPRQVGGARVTANFFHTLGVKQALGRSFLLDEDGLDNPAHAAHSVMISYRMWQQDLGGDPNVLGRILHVDSIPYTVIGVTPEDFNFWWRPHDIWIPVALNIHERDYRDLVVIARLNGTRAAAASELRVMARSLAEAFPKSDRGWTIELEDLKERLLNQTFRVRLMMLSGAVGLVLLLTCANIAGLLLARSAGRRREIAVRISLGATASRLMQQLLTESALLAFCGGLLGLALAWGLIKSAPLFVPANAIPGGAIELSWPVLLFCLALLIATCLLVGFVPALGLARTRIAGTERSNTTGRGSQKARQVIVAAEVAVALSLLAGALLMTSSLRNLANVDLGFDPANVLTVRIFLPSSKYNAVQAQRFYHEGLQRMAGLPSVKSVSVGTSLPLLNNMEVRFDREGTGREDAARPSAPYSAVAPQYFKTSGIPLLRGRVFTDADNLDAPLVAVVSEAMVNRFFPNEDPVGKRLTISRPVRAQSSEEVVKVEIVGVVGNVKLSDLAAGPKPAIYVPHSQNPYSRAVWFEARTEGNPVGLASAVRKEFAAIDREQPVEQVGSLAQMLETQLAQPKFQTGLMGSFAVVALLLSVLGIYGVNAYVVAQRRNEIGLRMALGASRGAVLRLVLTQGMLPASIGIGLGIAGAAAGAKALQSVLVGTETLNPIAFAGAATVLFVAAALACYFPALKATRIDPAIALRAE